MPRLARKNLNSNFLHVMVQGINREQIFKTDKQKHKYKQLILENNNNFEPNILSYCLMNNHSHFLIFCEDFTVLSKFMQIINMKYSNYYNKLNNRVGYVFRDRFKVQQIMNIDQLYKCLKYIHYNPVKANLCEKMEEYKYSSYNEFLGKKEILNDKSIELLFGCTQNYQEIFNIIHKNFNSDDFLDVIDTDITNFLSNFLKANNISKTELIMNKYLLHTFIVSAKKETKTSFKKISNLLNISIGKVSYHYRK